MQDRKGKEKGRLPEIMAAVVFVVAGGVSLAMQWTTLMESGDPYAFLWVFLPAFVLAVAAAVIAGFVTQGGGRGGNR